MEMLPEFKNEADAIFKDLKLNQKQAQSLVDFYIKKAEAAQQAPYDAYQALNKQWREEAEAHPDLKGKLGAGKEVNVRVGRMLDGLGDSQLVSSFKEAMDLTGAGNHPAFLRVFAKLAEKLSEGTPVTGTRASPGGQSAPGSGPRTAAQTLWPNLPTNRG